MRQLVLMLVLVCACRREAPPAEPAAPAVAPPAAEERPVPPELSSWSWSTISVAAGTVAQVRQTPSAKGRCRVVGSVGSEKLWSADGCLATTGDLRFVSPDATALVVVKPHPDANDRDFGAVYRKGEKITSLTSTSLHLPATATSIEGYSLIWLSTRDPRETSDGVELQLRDGSSLVIGFDGHVVPPVTLPGAPVAAAVEPATDGCSPCSYTDGEGVYHVVESAEEVPPRYRRVAGRIRGSIQHEAVVPHAPVTYSTASFEDHSHITVQTSERVAPQPRGGVGPDGRNELGENFIQYTTRIGNEAAMRGAAEGRIISVH